MKGIILAGGSGTRLYPLTKSTSKHLLPLYDKPMIYYAITTLMLAEIKDIMIITTVTDQHLYKELLKDGTQFGINICYEVQETPKGLAESFLIAKDFIKDSNVALMLGDNFFYGQSFSKQLIDMKNYIINNGGGGIFGTYVSDPAAYGVVELDKNNNVISIVEKPTKFISNYAVPGLYFFDKKVTDIASMTVPSQRGELEITSVIQQYLNSGKLNIEILGRGLSWLDAGTHDDLCEASNFVRTVQKRQGLLIGSPQEIAYKKGWISKKDLLYSIHDLQKNEYGKYLMEMTNGQ